MLCIALIMQNLHGLENVMKNKYIEFGVVMAFVGAICILGGIVYERNYGQPSFDQGFICGLDDSH